MNKEVFDYVDKYNLVKNGKNIGFSQALENMIVDFGIMGDVYKREIENYKKSFEQLKGYDENHAYIKSLISKLKSGIYLAEYVTAEYEKLKRMVF